MAANTKTTTKVPLPKWLTLWTRAFDTASKKAGVVVGIGRPCAMNERPTVVYLRPVGGGTEWLCAIGDLQPCPKKTGVACPTDDVYDVNHWRRR